MKGYKRCSLVCMALQAIFADILSYSRLMALCLSTGVIGQVINLLGDIAGPIPAIFICVIGHTANLLINALGAYVHTSRLQYVEFLENSLKVAVFRSHHLKRKQNILQFVQNKN